MSLRVCSSLFVFLFFKQKTAYEMRISDWSSDVCSSYLEVVVGEVDLVAHALSREDELGGDHPDEGIGDRQLHAGEDVERRVGQHDQEIGRASCRERVCQYV